jgi:hypothetical protein
MEIETDIPHEGGDNAGAEEDAEWGVEDAEGGYQ